MFLTGGPGGPGTVFYWHTGNPSILIVDNFGKSTYVKMESSCTYLDVLTQGK